ncbi:sugar kinase [Altererythrobacter salegens]|uniref:Sugar kinase n=1 Tax=Croceibacterium salegens TaxID=1737568 RepID=A0A6I4SXS7_9SPHN|nr:sugar kinase [Croceibacterium salegens]MXO60149.1 sugar kinase [Croceibacterium salegens]
MLAGRKRIVCVGEAMVELAPRGTAWDVGYGGDTLNQALHLARFGHDVAYFSALGVDPFAPRMLGDWAREGLDTSLVLRDPERATGLYAISIDSQGERRFTYWRSHSAARQLFAHPDVNTAMAQAEVAEVLVYSLISLAILPEYGREALLGLAREVRRRGGKVAFDGNYRASLWQDIGLAQVWRSRAAGEADYGFPTIDDERELSGTEDADEVAALWKAEGCGEVLVKLGGKGCRLPDGEFVPPAMLLKPVDSSGAGDAFSAGYLACRLRDASPLEAALKAHELAGWTVMRGGAIPPRDHAAPYSGSSSASPE